MARTASDNPPVTEQEAEPAMPKFDPYVEWVGSAGECQVTEEEWKAEGISDQVTVVWTKDSPRLPLSQLTEAARKRLTAEPHFKFVFTAPEEEM